MEGKAFSQLVKDLDSFVDFFYSLKINRGEQNTPKEIKDKGTSETGNEQEKEQLACQIFLKIANQYPDTADKITGMLMEMDIENLREINNDYDLLLERVSQAVQALEEEQSYKCNDDEKLLGASNDQQQDKELFHVRRIASELNLSSLKRQLVELEGDMQKELIGEELYKILFNIYPNYADKLTGMLLEMDVNNLLETLAKPELLKNRVEQAMEALDSNT